LRYLDPWTPPSLPVDSRTLDWLYAFGTPAAREAAYATLVSTPDTRPLLARLSRVSAPALVCAGGRDDAVRLANARRLSRELPNGRLEVFDSGAAPEVDRPAEFAHRITAFLAEADLPQA
jgi:pimeloyl-ACP methyl ester carboxylesterase